MKALVLLTSIELEDGSIFQYKIHTMLQCYNVIVLRRNRFGAISKALNLKSIYLEICNYCRNL
jgi:hypothetical protein